MPTPTPRRTALPTLEEVQTKLGDAYTTAANIDLATFVQSGGGTSPDPALDAFADLDAAEVAVLPYNIQFVVPQIGCAKLNTRPVGSIQEPTTRVVACDDDGAFKYLLDVAKASGRLTVSTFHQLCEDLGREAGTLPPKPEPAPPDWFSQALPRALDDAISALGPPFHAIVIRQAPDIPKSPVASYTPGWPVGAIVIGLFITIPGIVIEAASSTVPTSTGSFAADRKSILKRLLPVRS